MLTGAISDIDNELKSLRLQLKLMFLQLQFERYRREVHAERNRRLAGKSRSVKALDEHNLALVKFAVLALTVIFIFVCLFQKEQINLLQKDIDRMQTELDQKRKKMALVNDENAGNNTFWQTKFSALDKENQALQMANKNLQQQLAQQNLHILEINKVNILVNAGLIFFKLLKFSRVLKRLSLPFFT
jgi:Hamartin protein